MLVQQWAREGSFRCRFPQHRVALWPKDPSPITRRMTNCEAHWRSGAAGTRKAKKAADSCSPGNAEKSATIDHQGNAIRRTDLNGRDTSGSARWSPGNAIAINLNERRITLTPIRPSRTGRGTVGAGSEDTAAAPGPRPPEQRRRATASEDHRGRPGQGRRCLHRRSRQWPRPVQSR